VVHNDQADDGRQVSVYTDSKQPAFAHHWCEGGRLYWCAD